MFLNHCLRSCTQQPYVAEPLSTGSASGRARVPVFQIQRTDCRRTGLQVTVAAGSCIDAGLQEQRCAPASLLRRVASASGLSATGKCTPARFWSPPCAVMEGFAKPQKGIIGRHRRTCHRNVARLLATKLLLLLYGLLSRPRLTASNQQRLATANSIAPSTFLFPKFGNYSLARHKTVYTPPASRPSGPSCAGQALFSPSFFLFLPCPARVIFPPNSGPAVPGVSLAHTPTPSWLLQCRGSLRDDVPFLSMPVYAPCVPSFPKVFVT